MNEEQIEELMNHMLSVGKSNRERAGYKDENFLPVANIIGPNGESALAPLRFRDDREKHILMNALSTAARAEGAQAIVIVSDTRFTESPAFGEYFSIPKNTPVEKFQQDYLRILREGYGGEIKNLPRELWKEAVCVAIKGPLIRSRLKMAYYVEGEGDRVEWVEGDGLKAGDALFHMIPDWWDDGRPN
jgi:hypothetical protein